MENRRPVHIAHGTIRLSENKKIHDRLICFADEFDILLKTYKPNEFAIESIFTGKNVQSILKLGQIRGVAIMLAARAGCSIFEYPPAAVKMATAGYGRATKEQIRFMIQKILGLKAPPTPFDVSDALAVGVCHIQSTQLQRKLDRMT